MNPSLRERILRHLDTLPDEQAYHVLDFIEFMESKYASRTSPPASLFQRFTEGIEDTLRAGRVSAAAIGETVSLLNKAAGVLGGVAAAGKSVASDIVSAASRATESVTSGSPEPPAPPADAGATGPPASP